MDSTAMSILRPRDIPKMLARLVRVTLYIISGGIVGLGVMIALDAPTPRGTLLWLHSNGYDLAQLALFTALCGTLGVLLTDYARRRFWWVLALFFVVTLPYIFYAAAATYYVAVVLAGSRVTGWMYGMGYLFAFLLVLFVAYLSAWTGMSHHKGGG